jgi:hypothetical protein
MVRESALRPGANSAQLFELVERAGEVTLRRL